MRRQTSDLLQLVSQMLSWEAHMKIRFFFYFFALIVGLQAVSYEIVYAQARTSSPTIVVYKQPT
jgi:hypothetical protein